MTSVLMVENLKKEFSTSHGQLKAIDDVSFEIKKGETLALVGESGCGKSTVTRAILKLLEINQGNIFFRGKDILKARGKKLMNLRQQMGVVFQNPYSSLNPRMTIQDIIAEPLKASFDLSKANLLERVEKQLLEVGMGSQHMKGFPHQFSGGQLQRIAIARALALEPRLLILDEPTSALDVSVQAQILNLLKSLQQQRALSVLFISHNLATVEYIADHVQVMYMGKFVESGSVKEVFAKPNHPYTKALLDSIPSMVKGQRKLLKPLKGLIPSPLNLPPGCSFNPRCSYSTSKCFTQQPELLKTTGQRFVACYNSLDRT